MKRYSLLCVSEVTHLGRLFGRLITHPLLFISLLSVTGTSHAGEPISLTDDQLDSITAGFLEVNATANAAALGLNSLTDTFTDTVVIQGVPQPDGYVYSQGTAVADALAVGESVATGTSVGFTTDEEVISVQYENLVETTIVGYAKPKDKKAWNQKKNRTGKRDKKAWNQRKSNRDKKAWNQPKREKDKKAWNQPKREKDKKAWNQPDRNGQKNNKRNAKNDPNKKAWHKKSNKQTQRKDRRNDPNKKAWHKKERNRGKGHDKGYKGRRNDPNKKAWKKTPILQQREISTLVVVTRAGVAPPVVAVPPASGTPAF